MILVDISNPNTKQLIGKSGIHLWIEEPGSPIKLKGTASDLEAYSQAIVFAILAAVCQELEPTTEQISGVMLRIKQQIGGDSV